MKSVGKLVKTRAGTGLGISKLKTGFFEITSKVHEMYSNCKNFGHKNWAYDIETLLSKLGIFRNMAQTRN